MRIPWFTKEYFMVQASIQEDGEWVFVCCSCKRKQNAWEVIASFETRLVKDVVNWVGHVPLMLKITGKGVIQRSIDSNKYTTQELLAKVLPDARSSDFFIEVSHHTGIRQYKVTIARRPFIEALLTGFLMENIVVSHLQLGDLWMITDGMPAAGPAFVIKNKPEKIAANGALEPILKALGNDFLAEDKVIKSAIEANIVKEHRDQFSAFKRTRLLLTIGPILLFVLLLGNFIFYDVVEGKYLENEALIGVNQIQLDSISLLENQIAERTKLLGAKGQWGSIDAAFFSDQIASSVPLEVQLSELEIFPPNEQEVTSQIMEFANDTIRLKGNAVNSSNINDWVSKLNALHWVESVEIADFVQESANERGKFDLLLIVKR